VSYRIIGEEHGPASPIVVILHGFYGSGEELEPFAKSLSAPARFVFPDGPLDLSTLGLAGRAWWPMNVAARDEAIATKKPRDLFSWLPPELPVVRAQLEALLDELTARLGPAPLVLGGFSQGAMLACDAALHSRRELAGLVLFSGARIAGAEWAPLLASRRGTPIIMSHGKEDYDLSFAASESFRDDLRAAGCEVKWVPFDGGHEIPLVAWRELRTLLRGLARRSEPAPLR
jgi:phospholipase/carboxylesterase